MAFVSTADLPSNHLVYSSQVKPGFFDNICIAYGNLTSKPVALVLFVLALLALVAESNTVDGPFELIVKALKEYIAGNHPAPLKSIVSLVIGLLNFIISQKPVIFLVLLVFVIPLTYPETSPFIVFTLLLYILVSKSSAFWVLFVIQLVFIYQSLESTTDRIFVFIVIVFVVFGSNSISSFFTVKDGSG
ncbi:MAG: hypothetical protein 4 [Zeugodacus tau negev-like virus]|nr:MAG: hypothetical protein 4 [Zeugodacus tau negev-like virus]